MVGEMVVYWAVNLAFEKADCSAVYLGEMLVALWVESWADMRVVWTGQK